MDFHHMCPAYEAAAEVLFKRWTGLILRVLVGGPRRFSEFRQQVPQMNDRSLSDRLKELEEAGIVERIVRQTKPVSVEYRLTEKGRELQTVVMALQDWADNWMKPRSG